MAFSRAAKLGGDDQERIVFRLGELLGHWPGRIKSSKEPPWSETFAEDWWTLIKESMAEDKNKQGSFKMDDEDAAATKMMQDEAAKLKAEEAAKAATGKEGEKTRSKQPDPKADPASEPAPKPQPKSRGK